MDDVAEASYNTAPARILPRRPLCRVFSLGSGGRRRKPWSGKSTPSDLYWSACYNSNLSQIRHNRQNGDMTQRLPILFTLLLLTTGLILAVVAYRSQGGSATVPISITGSASSGNGPGESVQTRGTVAASAATTATPIAAEPAHAPIAPPVHVPAGAESVDPQVLLDAAIRALEDHRTITASIRQRANLFDLQMVGSGRYLEARQSPMPLIRLELKIDISEKVTSLVEVCDGRYLWTFRKLLNSELLSRIDAVRATTALEQLTADAGRQGATMVPGLGGPVARAPRSERLVPIHACRARAGGQPACLAARRGLAAGSTCRALAQAEEGDRGGQAGRSERAARPVARSGRLAARSGRPVFPTASITVAT